jgi:predicted peroxiredoxin
MSKKYLAALFATSALLSTSLAAEPAKGLNVIVTSVDRQTQMMAMVLSVQTMAAHGKPVNLTLCGPAGELALKTTETETFLPSKQSPSMLLSDLIERGAQVQVCPLYLPSAGKTDEDLLPGISIAKPPIMAGKLLDQDLQNLSF